MNPRLEPLLIQGKRFAPAAAFLGGFVWDALTLGRKVGTWDFLVLGSYLVLAAGLMAWMARDRHHPEPWYPEGQQPHWRLWLPPWLRFNGPYLAVQFLFGSLLSALFIFYFKSAGHLGTFLLSAVLAALLVGNEFFGRHYRRRFTLTWAMFGLCLMLYLNFLLPHLLGSLNPAWFYLSTLLGAGLVVLLHRLVPGRPGRYGPVLALAAALMGANLGDLIPPVPLVQKEFRLGTRLTKADGDYLLMVEKTPWWQFWQQDARRLNLPEGERLYCLAAVYAPKGLVTQMQHRWEYRDESGQWRQSSQARFALSGGREGGFRGYSYKDNPKPGQWRVSLVSEGGRTLSVTVFSVERGEADPDLKVQDRL